MVKTPRKDQHLYISIYRINEILDEIIEIQNSQIDEKLLQTNDKQSRNVIIETASIERITVKRVRDILNNEIQESEGE